MKKIGIIGSRSRNTAGDLQRIRAIFLKYANDEDIIISGGCPQGGDRFAEIIAKEDGYSITIHYPKFKKYGKPAAFFIRNSLIALDSDILIACRSEDRSGGTEDTIRKFLKRRNIENINLIEENDNISVFILE